MRMTFRRLIALFVAALVALAIVIPLPAAAYEGEPPVLVIVTPQTQVRCPGGTVFRATVLGPSGTGVPDVTLTWTLTSPDSNDRLARTPTKTNANGLSTNTLIVRPGFTPGTRTVTATATDPAGGTGTATVSCPAAGAVGGVEEGAGATPPFTGLPGTDVAPGTATIEPYGLLAALIALFAAIGLAPRILRRRRAG
jgi:hypothetical protein